MTTQETADVARALRPHGSVARQGVVTVLTFLTPLFGVLYFLTIPNGAWMPVLAGHAIVTVAVIAASIAYFSARIWVTPGGMAQRDFLGRIRMTCRGQIEQILLVHVYQGLTLNTQPQLFVIDRDGRRALRMRGPLWSQEHMRQLAGDLDLPLTTMAEASTAGELRQSHPQLLHWVERRPVAAAALSGVVIAAVATIAAVLLKTAGM